MFTNKNNVILTIGLAVAAIIGLNSFRLAGAANVEPDNASFYAMKDSLVSAINTFDSFSEHYVNALTAIDQNSSYRYNGETNFLRAKIQLHEQDLSDLLNAWQKSTEEKWSKDSTRFLTDYRLMKKEKIEIERETKTFISRH